jgi:hypothetical protein
MLCISTLWDSRSDRTLGIRVNGLAALPDTTWLLEDKNATTGEVHTTVNLIPGPELNGRAGTFTTSWS